MINLKKIKNFFKQNRLKPDQKKMFVAGLNRESSHLLLLVGILGSVAWLGFLRLDNKIHPGINLAPFRLGFSVSSISMLILYYFLKKDQRDKFGIILLSIPLSYVVFVTPYITGLTGLDPSYAGGLNIVIMLFPLAPLPLMQSLLMILVSALVLALNLQQIDFADYSVQYTLQNVSIAYIVSATFCYLMNGIRIENYKKTILINNNLIETENLLKNILPEEIAVELKLYGSATPIKYRSATVLFTDFVGFTTYTKDLSPDDLIRELDMYFSYFDTLTEEYKLEKLKTIGDSYMCAGGIPTPNTTHPVDSTLAALDMQNFFRQMRIIREKENKPHWEVRIGINTGPIVAGVVGKIKFAYDVWGDTVNIASRMEEYGMTDEINVSQATKEIIKDFFVCLYRGQITVKNNEIMDMYLVKGLRTELSENGDGKTPNELFWEKYNALKHLVITE